MIKKILIFLLIISYSLPLAAQDKPRIYTLEDLRKVEIQMPNGETKDLGQISVLNNGEPAPYAGYLLDVEAMANNITKYRLLLNASDTALLYQRQYDLELLNLETKKLFSDIQLEKNKNQIIVDGKDKEIKRLKKINKDIVEEKTSFWDDVLLVTEGVVVGILLGLVTGLAVSK
jgi:hypothetical protein